MNWRPTPPDKLIKARKLAGDSWVDMEMKDLRPGDIFRCVSVEGELIEPGSQELNEECVALCTDYPVKNYNNQIGSLFGEQGYGVPMELFVSMDELKRKGLS